MLDVYVNASAEAGDFLDWMGSRENQAHMLDPDGISCFFHEHGTSEVMRRGRKVGSETGTGHVQVQTRMQYKNHERPDVKMRITQTADADLPLLAALRACHTTACFNFITCDNL